MKKVALLIFTLTVLLTLETKAQSLKIGPVLGLSKTQTSQDYSDYEIPEFEDEVLYGLKGKLNFPFSPVTFTASVTYIGYSKEFLKNELETSLFSIGLGGEFNLISGPINPYLSADFLINSFGKYTLKNNLASSEEIKLSDGLTRYGIGLGGGLSLGIFPNFDIDIFLKYNFNNLINKKDGEDNFNNMNIGASVLFKIL